MATGLKVYACVDWDEANQTCTTHAYIDPPTVLPTMSAEDGYEIGWLMIECYLAIKLISMLRYAMTDRW